ncbi:MAG: GGDEF domain-containing protein [Phycisphaerae bacterium]|nr:GGDEF domain-containing protein [Phycisphaerae bacterium]
MGETGTIQPVPTHPFPINVGNTTAAFQPIVDVSTGVVAAYEALTRPLPGNPFSNPGQLFNWAEHHGLLWETEQVTRAVSLSAASQWPAGVQLFLNNSPQVFADPRFAESLLESVRTTPGLTPGRIVLEITERSEQQHVEGLDAQVRKLREAGFQIAIDDVGAGTSGLNRIMALRPDWLKIDRELVGGIDQDRVKQNLMRFFVHFARLSGVRLIAEGIERREELVTLIELGVTYAQGFYVGRPGSREQTLDPTLGEWLREQWRGALSERFRDPRRTRVSRLAKPAQTAPASSPVREVAGQFLRQATLPGIAVLDGGRFVGWCERDQVLRAAGDLRAAQPIGFLVSSDSVTATGETTVLDALDLVLSRDDRSLGRPLVLVDEGRVTGIVTMRDLLHAIADVASNSQSRIAPVTGLPGRVRAEEHLRGLIAQHGVPPMDAALIDVRNFHAYNTRYGFDLGDQLLRRVVTMLQLLVAKGETAAFLAHLGDDRFLVTAPAGQLSRRLPMLLQQFDRELDTAGGSMASARPMSTTDEAPGVGLRAVLLPTPFGVIDSPRDLMRAASDGRRELGKDTGHSVLITASIQPGETQRKLA